MSVPAFNKTMISMGAMSEPLHAQIACPKEWLEHEQADADAITRLAVRGVLTEAEVHRARKRLVKRIGVRIDEMLDEQEKGT